MQERTGGMFSSLPRTGGATTKPKTSRRAKARGTGWTRPESCRRQRSRTNRIAESRPRREPAPLSIPGFKWHTDASQASSPTSPATRSRACCGPADLLRTTVRPSFSRRLCPWSSRLRSSNPGAPEGVRQGGLDQRSRHNGRSSAQLRAIRNRCTSRVASCWRRSWGTTTWLTAGSSRSTRCSGRRRPCPR